MPACGDALVSAQDALSCANPSCGQTYPVIGGVPTCKAAAPFSTDTQHLRGLLA